MFICITNNKEKNSEMYDNLYELTNISEFLRCGNWYISKNGITNKGFASDKKELQKDYKRGINQIVMNDRNTNFTQETDTGEIIEFVGINNHLEKEIE